jgi:hypothetical protein
VPPRALHIRSDIERKVLAGVDNSSVSSDPYSRQASSLSTRLRLRAPPRPGGWTFRCA